ncbi:MAG TPA: prolipoprotein diacylglyceryl transferase family protein [Bacteroidales bacterium]|nr:prolipoprotein diacylglyceryl transferase family protein [Bacteroidales bacterium]
MFPRISDLINYLLGTHLNIPIQSYGFMMAVAFVAGGFIIFSELKRKEKEGILRPRVRKVLKGGPPSFQEVFFSGLFGFLLGWKGIGMLLEYSFFSRHPQDFILSGKGSLIGGLLLGGGFAFFAYYSKKRRQLKEPVTEEVTIHPYEITGNILLIAAIFGIIGSKVFDIMEHFGDVLRDPVGTLISFSGLSFYGGLIFAAFAVGWYAYRNGIRFPDIADVVAPGLILAYAIGRIGCQLAGDGCWGIPNLSPKPHWMGFLPDWVWAFNFPHNVIDSGNLIPGCGGDHCYILTQPVYPTSLYETLMGVVIFAVLWSIRKQLRIPGYLFCVYLILNGTERFLIELIRVNQLYNVLGLSLTQAQIIAIVLILLGATGFFFFRWLNRRYLRTRETPSKP